MKRYLPLLLLLMLFIPTLAEDEPTEYKSGDFGYILLDDGTAEITQYFGTDAVLRLPETIDGFTVTSLGDDISTMISSPEVQRIFIPDTLTHTTGNPFQMFSALTNFVVSPDHPVFAEMEGVLFRKADKALIAFPNGMRTQTYRVPYGILAINDYAFAYSPLMMVTMPDSVTFIDACAFNQCSGLRSITLSYGMTAIPDGFLTNCWRLRGLTIPDSVTTIGSSALAYCDSLTTVTIPASVTFIAPDAFEKSPNVTLLVPRASYARQYAVEHGIAYTYEDADSWLN